MWHFQASGRLWSDSMAAAKSHPSSRKSEESYRTGGKLVGKYRMEIQMNVIEPERLRLNKDGQTKRRQDSTGACRGAFQVSTQLITKSFFFVSNILHNGTTSSFQPFPVPAKLHLKDNKIANLRFKRCTTAHCPIPAGNLLLGIHHYL